MLRTQHGDEKAASGKLWNKVTSRAVDDGVALRLPLDEMGAAMAPLGRGSVGMGADAKALMKEARDIGTYELPPVTALPKERAINSQSLEQAVRAAGGIRGGSGELRDLGIKQSGTTGLINNKSGREADLLAEEMYQRGFIPDNDPATLFDALRNGGGRKLFANDQVENTGLQRMAEVAMGDAPEAERVAQAIPFDQFQRLRASAGELAAKAGTAGNKSEAKVLNDIKDLLSARVDDASAGNLLDGEVMPSGFKSQYNAARDSTRKLYDRYAGGDNVEAILEKPVGQTYRLTGDEITNKLWHGGSGLAEDVARFRDVLSGNNGAPAMAALQKFILTDAAGKTNAAGNFGAALPRYVETRLPGLQEALTPEQLHAVTSVASDIRNAEAAASIPGLRGSDTQAKMMRALDAGLLDSSIAKTLGRFMSVKGIGLETMREKLAEVVKQNKGKTISQLLANPKEAAAALEALDGPLSDPRVYGAFVGANKAMPVAGASNIEKK